MLPIKATKLRAGFLLLLFTLMFISSNSLIIGVYAETLEESFKNTPLPFWDIETTGNIQYVNNSILFESPISEGLDWLDGWTYRKNATINYSSGAGNNYTVPIFISSISDKAIEEFTYVSKTGSDVESSQGIATDGNDFWTTSGGTAPPPNNMYLYKYNSTWVQQDFRDCSSDATEEIQQINHIFYYDDYLYIGANNYNNETYRSYILKYNASTLDFENEIEVKNNTDWIEGWTEGCSYYNGSWWVIWTDRMIITQYNSNWEYITEHNLSYEITGDVAAKYQGLIWLNNYVYLNIHYGGDPDKIDCYYFNGTTFNEIARLEQPHSYASQGMFLDATDNETVYFAIRGGADNEKVCWANIILSPEGDFNLGDKCQSDFDDIRFTDNDGISLLSYWIQDLTGTSARFWVNVNDSLSSENQLIYCYYGNSTVSNISNGDKTFSFFDDFNRADNDTIGKTWTDDVGSGNNENGITSNELSVNSYEHYYSHAEDTAPSLSDFCVEVELKNDNDTSGTWHPSIFLYWTAYEWFSVGPRMDGQEKHHGYDNDGGTSNHYGDACSFDTWYYYKIMLNGSDINIDVGTSWNNYNNVYDLSRTSAFEGATDLIILGKGFSVSAGSYPNANLDNNGGVTGGSNKGSFYDNVFMRKYVYDEPDIDSWGDETLYYEGGEYEEGSFSIEIPINQFKNHKFEFMVSTENITSGTLDFSIYDELEFSNWGFELNLDTHFFEQEDFELNFADYNFLRFKVDLKYSHNLYSIRIYDVNNSKIDDNLLWENIIKTGNIFFISSTNFTGFFKLFYFTGTVDYSTTWKEQVISASTLVEDTLLTASAMDDNVLDSYEKRYTQYVSNFQFLRTNMYMWSEYSLLTNMDYIECKIRTHFYYPNGTIQYLVTANIERTRQFMYFTLRFYQGDEWSVPIYTSFASKTISNIAEESVQFAVWRTQENYLGAFYNVDDTWTVRTEDPTRFVTNMTLENFQGNISIMYRVTDLYGAVYRNFIIELNGFEFGYGGIDGVAEPHFSTTWWNALPIIGPIINAVILMGNTIGALIEAGLLPITAFLDSIFGAIGGVAGTVWALFEGSLDDLGISLDAIASDVFGFFDAILNSIDSMITDVYTAIVNLNDNFVEWVTTGITNALVPALLAGIESMIDAFFVLWEYQLNLVGTALGWGAVGTFLFDLTDSVVLSVPSWLAFIISVNLMMIDIFVFVNALYAEYGPTFILYGGLFIAIDILTAVMTMDLDVIGECLTKYIKAIAFVAEFMLNIISTILNAIWGILPF